MLADQHPEHVDGNNRQEIPHRVIYIHIHKSARNKSQWSREEEKRWAQVEEGEEGVEDNQEDGNGHRPVRHIVMLHSRIETFQEIEIVYGFGFLIFDQGVDHHS